MLDGRLRTSVQKGLDPVGAGLRKVGVTADVLTVLGLACAVATAWLIAVGAWGWAVVALVGAGLTDVLDGTVARGSGKAGPRGAFFDSVTDRVADALFFGGVAWYYADREPRIAVLALAVLALSMLVTYERARAEALGFDGRGGLMERAERMIVLGVGLALDVVVPVLWVMLALTAFTAVQRFVKVWRQATAAEAGRPAAPAEAGAPAAPVVVGRRTAPARPLRVWWEERQARRPRRERPARARAGKARRRTRP